MAVGDVQSSPQLPLPDFESPKGDTVYFDLETQYSFDEVGGRSKIHRLKLAVAVTFSMASGAFKAYTEEQAQELLEELRQAELVVGFNVRAFDYKVLQPYADFRLTQINTLDIMDHVVAQLGFRLSLDTLASATLGEGKSGDGLQSIRWFREGDLPKVIAYCQKDVELVRRLYEFGAEKGCLWYHDRYGGKRRLAVNWGRNANP